MIIYNTQWLSNLRVHEQADIAQHTGAITAAEVHQIKRAHPVGFYSPGIFVRAGLFVLTCIIAILSALLLTSMLAEAHLLNSAAWTLILGLFIYIILEVMTKRNNYYKAGVDNALLWLAGALFVGAFAMFADKPYIHQYELMGSIYIGVISLIFTLRFANALMSTVCSLAWLGIVFFGWQQLGSFGTATLPFIMMAASALMYIVAARLQKLPQNQLYETCLTVAQTVSLLVLYAAGNYYIIDELQRQLMNSNSHPPAALKLFFWVWTIGLPFLYIAWGVAKKRALPLRAGIILVAAAAITFRNYYHVLPPEWALTLSGTVLLIVVYAVIRYLKVPRYGLTYAEQYGRNSMERLNAESLISASVTSHITDVPANAPASRFGGGNFGGGGSSGGF